MIVWNMSVENVPVRARHRTRPFDEAIARIGQQIAHPLRVRLLSYVAAAGPCSFSELVERVGGSAAQVSNHLASLRESGLLVSQRMGRQSVYRLPNAHLAEVLTNLAAAAGVTAAEAWDDQERRTVTGSAHAKDLADARRCYDHIGGSLGVQLLQTLTAGEALSGGSDAHDELRAGPKAATLLPRFGVSDWTALPLSRRRFAYNCPDWTEKTPHLGGVLGSAIARHLGQRGWIEPLEGTRAIAVTTKGRRALAARGVRA